MTETGKKEKMNLPNKLTIIRVVMILPFVVLLLGSHEGWGWFQAIFGKESAVAEFIALAMLACQYRNLISIAIVLIWVMMTLIICYVNLIEVKEED